MTNTPTHAEMRGQPLGRGALPPLYANHEEYEAALLSRAEAAERALSDLINDLSDSNQADIPIHRVAVRSDQDALTGIASLLKDLLAEVRRGNSTAREGAVSSIQIEDNPTKDRAVRISTKHYTGSELDVMHALDLHGLAHVEAERRAMNLWAETLSDLAEQKAG